MTRYYLPLLLLLILISSKIALCQVDRHTMGFPEKYDYPGGVIVISINNTQIITVEPTMQPSKTPSNLSDIERIIESGKSPLTTLDKYRLGDLSKISALDAILRINNEELKNILLEMYRANKSITPEELKSIMSYIKSLKAQGALSPVDEILALRALIDMLEESNEYYTNYLLAEMYAVLRELEARESLTDFTRYTPPLTSQEQGGGESISLYPQFHFPQSQWSLPRPLGAFNISIEQVVTYLALFAGAAGFLFLLRVFDVKPSVIFSRVKHSVYALLSKWFMFKSTPTYITTSDLLLDMYWRSVHVVEKYTRVKLEPSNTHREYLELVRSKLAPELFEIFDEITMAYEMYRYSGSREAGELIPKHYGDLVRRIEAGINPRRG